MTDNQCRQLAALACIMFRTKNKNKKKRKKRMCYAVFGTVKVSNILLLMLPGQIFLVLSLLQRWNRKTLNMLDIYDLRLWKLQLV